MRRRGLIILAAWAVPALAAATAVWRLTPAPTPSLDLMNPGRDEPAVDIICAEGHMVEISVGFRHHVQARLRNDEWIDAQGHAAPWPARMRVASGAVAGEFPATAEPEDEGGGTYVVATLPARSNVLAAFATTGAIRFVSFGETVVPPRVPVANAARLVAACRR